MKMHHELWIGLIVHASLHLAHGQQNNAAEGSPPGEPVAEVYREPDVGYLTLSVEHRRMFGHGYKSFTEGRLGGELIEDDHHGLAAFIFGGLIELEKSTSTRGAAHDPGVVGFGLGYRYYFTHEHTFIRPYVAVEGQFLWMAWKYREAVVFGDETIRYDSTKGADGYLGFGIFLRSNKFVNLFGEIGAGGGFFPGDTDEGLENDLFGPYGYIGVRVGLTIRF